MELVEEDPETAFMTQRVPKAMIKQLDKEVAWGQIPPEEQPLYVEAELKQWKEHLHYQAVRMLSKEETEKVRREIPKERILRCRFAYRDKNVAKRREDPTIPCKAKARLCIGGHRDPDLAAGELNTEAPTATKHSFVTLMFLAAQNEWDLAAGDVEAAFLNGEEARRNLFFEQPERGLLGEEPGCLVEVIKGVFGLSTSPRLWWEKLSRELREVRADYQGKTLTLHSHPLHACFFILRDADLQPYGALITHVDDILIAANEEVMREPQGALSKIFPISTWEAKEFDYIGSQIRQDPITKEVKVSQRTYVNTRLETVDIPAGTEIDDLADQVAKQDNMSTVGTLSWLASQTRPDLQVAASMAQRRQRAPTYRDIKETNRAVDGTGWQGRVLDFHEDRRGS